MENYQIVSLRFGKSREEVLVCFDNDTAVKIPIDIVYHFKLNKGLVITQETYNKLLQEIRVFQAKRLAYSKATSSLKSRFQLKKILMVKGFTENEVDIAIKNLEQLNIIDDEKYAKMVFDFLSRKKGYGINRIKQYLNQKGVPKKTIEKVINQGSMEIDQDQLIINYYERHLAKIKRKPSHLRVPYCIRMFHSAGFLSETVNNFLRNHKTEIIGL